MALVSSTLPTLPIEAALLTLLDVTLHGRRAAVPGKLLGLRTSADIESVVVQGQLPFRERFMLVTAVSRDGRTVRVSDGKSSILASCSERLSREAASNGTVPFPASLRDRCLFMNGIVRLRAASRQSPSTKSPLTWTDAMRTHAARLYWQWFRDVAVVDTSAQPWSAFLKSVSVESFVQVEIELIHMQSATWAFSNRMTAGDVEDVNTSLRVRRRLATCLSQLLAPIECRTGILASVATPDAGHSDTTAEVEQRQSEAALGIVTTDSGVTPNGLPLLSTESLRAPPAALAASMRAAAMQRLVQGRDPRLEQRSAVVAAAASSSLIPTQQTIDESGSRSEHEALEAERPSVPSTTEIPSSIGHETKSSAEPRPPSAAELEAAIAGMDLPSVEWSSTAGTWGCVGDAEPDSVRDDCAAAEAPRAEHLQAFQQALMSMRVDQSPPHEERSMNQCNGGTTDENQLSDEPQLNCASLVATDRSNELGSAVLVGATLQESITVGATLTERHEANSVPLGGSIRCTSTAEVEPSKDGPIECAPIGEDLFANDGSGADRQNNESIPNGTDDSRAPRKESRSRREMERSTHENVSERVVRPSSPTKTASKDNDPSSSFSDEDSSVLGAMREGMSPVPRKRCNAVLPDGDHHEEAAQSVRVTRRRHANRRISKDAKSQANGSRSESKTTGCSTRALLSASSENGARAMSPSVDEIGVSAEDKSRTLTSSASPTLETAPTRRSMGRHRSKGQDASPRHLPSPPSRAMKRKLSGDCAQRHRPETAFQKIQIDQAMDHPSETLTFNGAASDRDLLDTERTATGPSSTTDSGSLPEPQDVCMEPASENRGNDQAGEARRSTRRRSSHDAVDRAGQRRSTAVQPDGFASVEHKSSQHAVVRRSSRGKKAHAASSDDIAFVDLSSTLATASGNGTSHMDIQTLARDNEHEDATVLRESVTPREHSSSSSTNRHENAYTTTGISPSHQTDTSAEPSPSQDALPPWARYLRNLGQWRFFSARTWRTRQ
ncbi:hypothetical protein CCYA_CCYA02G0755 [Cyanidiococcus yangmingshanensis]|nr:hypothetical protein CCYA_CCYA02G0755 [Cyanidiococcus yangmingshanensis]